MAILGCGPSGLIAAHAAEGLGHHVVIFSRKVKSQMFGAMYLHEMIPGITPVNSRLEIQVVKLGSREGYAATVYGDPEAPVSWDKFKDGPTPGWSLAETYDILWDRYESKIIDAILDWRGIGLLPKRFDKVFSTIPAPKLCEDWTHKFEAVQIFVVHGQVSRPGKHYNVMYYNGLPSNGLGSWYRYSLIRGYQSWEYSLKTIPRFYEAQLVEGGMRADYGTKPLHSNCNCRPEITRLGRFGKWDKHTFTHHSYQEVRSAL